MACVPYDEARTNTMELRHLRYFVGVAEDMNFSRAAERLHVAQSALSRQIQDLEGEVGVQLFVRDKRGIVLTAAGKAFLDDARRLVAQSQQAIETARRAARGEVGRLDIGYIGALSDGLIPRLIRKFRAQFPEVDVKLHALRPARQVEALHQEEIHLGFIGMPFGDQEAALCFEVFRRDRMIVALPAGHALAARRAVKLPDLAAERFIFLTRAGTPVYYDWLMRLCHDAGYHPNIVQEVESGETAVELVAAGSGVALFPETAQRQLHGDMSFHPLAGKVPRFEYAVAWRRVDPSPALQAFLELLRAEVAGKRPAPPAKHAG
jgi:DNA-binding transcriptional LysR family regulator